MVNVCMILRHVQTSEPYCIHTVLVAQVVTRMDCVSKRTLGRCRLPRVRTLDFTICVPRPLWYVCLHVPVPVRVRVRVRVRVLWFGTLVWCFVFRVWRLAAMYRIAKTWLVPFHTHRNAHPPGPRSDGSRDAGNLPEHGNHWPTVPSSN